MASALIFGVTGQDGSYLSELLLGKGYTVHGVMRRASNFNTQRVDHLYQDPHEKNRRFLLHYGDLSDGTAIDRLVGDLKPDEIYNLAAQSHVGVSFQLPILTADIGALGGLRILEAIRRSGRATRYYQASSSEMFGSSPPPQNESTPFHPRSPYGCAKVYTYHQTVNYREAYGMFASNGILFNHESPRRPETFVTRKVTAAAARIKKKKQEKLYLGNLKARRDWGFAGDYVEAMWRMLQAKSPDDFVVATGESHSVQELCETAFGLVGLDWKKHVEIDAKYVRPSEVDDLCGDASKAKKVLKWKPTTTFKGLIEMMVKADMESLKP